jgi:hypothetical protein
MVKMVIHIRENERGQYQLDKEKLIEEGRMLPLCISGGPGCEPIYDYPTMADNGKMSRSNVVQYMIYDYT